ncbi:ATP-dependent DNA helicase PIF1 [Phanerochaete sordida]|uniref:ATP-dependent DNA helicase n=1 Tax=Phanerochaete sordida TaxID=48140 RepID=A0A9P3G3X1_9APHY|nr:ATP-dependent DNA helicase PIF1 [Phanerochaete sordida]
MAGILDQSVEGLSLDDTHQLRARDESDAVKFTTEQEAGLGEIIRELREERNMKSSAVAVTASTGLAALSLGGSTIHSWAGIGDGKKDVEELLVDLVGPERYHRLMSGPDGSSDSDSSERVSVGMQRWLDCRVLIIDEISMLDGALLDKLEHIARFIRESSKPFGDIQLVLSGDFLQLPPIGNSGQAAVFAFKSQCWKRCVERTLMLHTVFRQKEKYFIDQLHALRAGKITPEAVAFFRSLSRHIQYTDGIQPTELFPRKDDANAKNLEELEKILGDTRAFLGADQPGWDPATNQIFAGKPLQDALDSISVPKLLPLKQGAQVMLLKNLVQGVLVNGSLGVVTRFCCADEAWRSPDVYLGVAIGLAPLSGRTFSDAAEAAAMTEVEELRKDPRTWPVVRFFQGRSREHTVDVCCVHHTFVARHATGGIAASRKQVPLMLAYALTIHKSQGQTLERVKVDLKRAFAPGHCYVALSRAVSADTLQVLNFDPAKVVAAEAVLRWLAGLERQEAARERARRRSALERQETFSVDGSLRLWEGVLDECSS